MEHVWVVGCEGPWERTYDSKEEAIAYLRKIKARHEGFDLDADLTIGEDKVELLLWHGQPGPERWLAFKREVKGC